MTGDRYQPVLVLLLRVGGGLACTAVFAIFLVASLLLGLRLEVAVAVPRGSREV